MKREDIDRIASFLGDLKCKTQKEVEEARVRLLGKKGEITALFDEFRNVDRAQKAEFGKALNELKQKAMAKIEELKVTVADSGASDGPKADLSMPGDPFELGSRHPVSIVRQEIVDIFRKFGYDVAEGPEIEDDYHVFEALNFPANHPARDMQDTFFVSAGHPNPLLLRTHTSSVQVRTMEKRSYCFAVRLLQISEGCPLDYGCSSCCDGNGHPGSRNHTCESKAQGLIDSLSFISYC